MTGNRNLRFVNGADEGPLFSVTIIAMIFSVTADFSELDHLRAPVTDQNAEPLPPTAILDRLPLDKRGALLALSAEDHHTCVRRSKGNERILLRRRDAIRETGDLAGARVHRSPWIAFGAVTHARRDGDRAVLTLKNGSEIPVSRANFAKIKDTGLLPA